MPARVFLRVRCGSSTALACICASACVCLFVRLLLVFVRLLVCVCSCPMLHRVRAFMNVASSLHSSSFTRAHFTKHADFSSYHAHFSAWAIMQ